MTKYYPCVKTVFVHKNHGNKTTTKIVGNKNKPEACQKTKIPCNEKTKTTALFYMQTKQDFACIVPLVLCLNLFACNNQLERQRPT